MAKRTKRNLNQAKKVTKPYTVPSNGRKITLQQVSYYKVQAITERIEKGLRERGLQLDAPTFEVEVAGGDKQIHEHYHEIKFEYDENGKVILDENGEPKELVVRSSLKSDEDFAAWEAYLAAQKTLQNAAAYPTLKYALRNGVIAKMSDTPGWEEEQELDGIDVPEKPAEKYLHYVLTEVLPTPQEQGEASEIILAISIAGRDEETEAAVRKLFRGEMEGNPE